MKAIIILSSLSLFNANAAVLNISWSSKGETNKHLVQFSCKIQDNRIISLNDANYGVERTTTYDNSFFQKELKELKLREEDKIIEISDKDLKNGKISAKYKVGNTIVKHDLYNLNGRTKKFIIKKETKDSKILRILEEAEKMCLKLI
jgi:hypothetical protein